MPRQKSIPKIASLANEEAYRLINGWRSCPQAYFQDVLGVEKIWRLQDELLSSCPRAIEEHKHIYIGSGHCFAKGTQVLMCDGTVKAVEDVCVGDKVMGDDSLPRVVHGLARGREKMYRVEYYDGTEYVHNESHILSLKAMSNHGTMVKDKVYDFTIRDYLSLGSKWRRRLAGYRVGVEFSEKYQEIPAYIFGLWLGDGSKTGPDFCNKDKEILAELRDYCDSLGCEFVDRGNGKNYYFKQPNGDRNNRNTFIEKIKGLGVHNNKHIPAVYLTGSKRQRLELLAGIIDSDGSKHKDGGYEVTQKRKILADQIVFLARSLGIKSSISKRFISTKFKSGHEVEGTYYRVYLSSGVKVPCRVSRKKSSVELTWKRNVLHTGIREVECLGDGDYYGFNIDGNQRFLGSDFMVLHNSLGKDWCCGGIALWFLHCYSPSIVIETGPTDRQVKKVMWGETMAHWNKRKIDLGGKPYTDPYLEIRKEDWYLLGFTTKESGASKEASGGKFQGFHAPNVCVIVTEAQAVEDNIFDQIDAVTTNENVLVIFLGNPTRASGRFAKGLRDKENNIVFNFSCLENPNYTEKRTVIPGLCSYEWVEDKRRKWGENDPRWQGRVLGQIPDSSINNVFSQKLIDKGLKVEDTHGLLHNNGVALDVAGEGDDDNVLMGGKRGVVKDMLVKNVNSASQNAIDAVKMCEELEGIFVVVDCDGMGIKEWQELTRIPGINDRYHLVKFHGSKRFPKPVNQTSPGYENLKSKACFIAQERLEGGLASVPDDQELIEELLEIKFFENKRGLLQIEDNEDLKDRIGRSPDRAMAWIMLQYGFSLGLDPKIGKRHDPYGEDSEEVYPFNPSTV